MAPTDPANFAGVEPDDSAIMDRAEVIYWEPPVVREPFWRADDPKTGCVGVGESEREARVNLVHAVRAHQQRDDERGFYSVGPHQTVPITWRRKSRLQLAIDRVLGYFS
ncbi:MAG: hypothetical protein R3324_18590 [Halobacteriales archaeon]|nr:hypothetical protein [Halobacteriales archaeon]